MKCLLKIVPVFIVALGLALPARANTVLVHDTWADGSRSEQNLPGESAWHASNAASLTAAVGSMTGFSAADTSRMWMTYFTAPGSAAELQVGESLRITAVFTPNGVAPQNTSRGVRIGLFDYSNGTRVAGDGTFTGGTGNGENVTGYMLNMNFGQNFGNNTPLNIMKRTTIGGENLMGTDSIYSSIGSGPGGVSGQTAFIDGVEYTFQMQVSRQTDAVQVSVSFSDGMGWSISHSATDTDNLYTGFDTFVFRTDITDRNAESFTFSEFKVEVISPLTPGQPGILVDDTWADGSRAEQNLPDESAWYATPTASLYFESTGMSGSVADSSRTWWTYFTDDPAIPARVEVGQTLKATVEFTLSGVSQNSNRGLRIGLYDVSGGLRRDADGGSPEGAGVEGYMLNMNFAQILINNPLQIQKRIASHEAWMSSGGAYATLSSGGGGADSPGFSDGTPYTLEFSVTRNADSVEITTTFSDDSGWSISHTATDSSSLVDNFDAFGFRPERGDRSATIFTFSRFKVELLGEGTPVPPTIVTHPQDETVTQGATAVFTVEASGSTPLSYEWYHGSTPLAQTGPTLTLEDVQPAQAGEYTVVVSNHVGFASSNPATLTVLDPVAPTIVEHPQSQTVTEGQNVTFSVIVEGTEPLTYEWYSNETLVGTDAVLTLNNVQTSNAGNYHVVVTNELGFDTSDAATLTVNPMAPGTVVVLDDTWADGTRNVTSFPDQSAWFASQSSSLLARPGSLLGTNITSSRVWLTYFTEQGNPVDLAVGQMIRATLVFTPTNVATFAGGTQRGLRIALLNYSDGGTRLAGDGFGSSDGNGQNVTGYMLNQNFYATFSQDAPMELRARTNLASGNLIGTTGDYFALGTGPSGYMDEPGFVSGTQYTLEFSVARHEDSVDVTTRIVGGTLNISHTETDADFAFHRFDCFVLRPNNAAQSADHFHFTQFKVETLPIPPQEELPFAITSVTRPSADQLEITWEAVSGRTYEVQTRGAVDQGAWVVVGSTTATGATASLVVSGVSSGAQAFYRVVQLP